MRWPSTRRSARRPRRVSTSAAYCLPSEEPGPGRRPIRSVVVALWYRSATKSRATPPVLELTHRATLGKCCSCAMAFESVGSTLSHALGRDRGGSCGSGWHPGGAGDASCSLIPSSAGGGDAMDGRPVSSSSWSCRLLVAVPLRRSPDQGAAWSAAPRPGPLSRRLADDRAGAEVRPGQAGRSGRSCGNRRHSWRGSWG